MARLNSWIMLLPVAASLISEQETLHIPLSIKGQLCKRAKKLGAVTRDFLADFNPHLLYISWQSSCPGSNRRSIMKNSRINLPRFIVGVVLVVVAILMLLFGDYATAGVAAVGVVGLISIATSRRDEN